MIRTTCSYLKASPCSLALRDGRVFSSSLSPVPHPLAPQRPGCTGCLETPVVLFVCVCFGLFVCLFIFVCLCRWEGKGDTEIGKDKASGKILVRVDPKYYRPAEVVSDSCQLTLSF